jgi:pyruvate-ferredoxin/flavodoxin oxidoreductase
VPSGYDLRHGVDQQKLAVQSGFVPLYRFDPRRIKEGKPPLHLDSKEPKLPLKRFTENETRFRMVEKIDPDRFKRLAAAAQREVTQRFAVYQQLAGLTIPSTDGRNGDEGKEE